MFNPFVYFTLLNLVALVQDDGWNKFATSGLTTSSNTAPNPYVPKKSWYMMATFKAVFQHTRLAGEAQAEVQGGVQAQAQASGRGGHASPSTGANGSAAPPTPRVARFHRDPAFTDGPEVVSTALASTKPAIYMYDRAQQ